MAPGSRVWGLGGWGGQEFRGLRVLLFACKDFAFQELHGFRVCYVVLWDFDVGGGSGCRCLEPGVRSFRVLVLRS